MSFFIFLPNLDNVEGTLYKIAENQSDLNNLNITQSVYKIIQDSQENFNDVKYGNKLVVKYNNNIITFTNQITSFAKKEQLQEYVDEFKNQIKQFLNNNPNHLLFNRWSNYYNQLNNLNLGNINYTLTMSLEQYFKDLGQPSYNILQIP